MDEAARFGVRVERQEDKPQAKIMGGGEYGRVLASLLEKQGVSATNENGKNVRYVFFFVSPNSLGEDWKNNLESALGQVVAAGGKFLLILDNVSEAVSSQAVEKVQKNGWPVTIFEIKGFLGPGESEIVEGMGKIIRSAFSRNAAERNVIVGKDSSYRVPPVVAEIAPSSGQYMPRISDETVVLQPMVSGGQGSGGGITNNTQKSLVVKQKVRKKRGVGFYVMTIIGLTLLPLIILGGIIGLGAWNLKQAKEELAAGQYLAAKANASRAENSFEIAKDVVGTTGAVGRQILGQDYTQEPYAVLDSLEIASNTLYRVAGIQPAVLNLPKALLSDEEIDISQASKEILLESGQIDQNLGIIEAYANSGQLKGVSQYGGLVGVSPEKIDDYLSRVSTYRKMLRNGEEVLRVFPDLVGVSGRKTYLVVFQNSAELRATGGFIGSYAVVHFDGGKMLDYKINDIYSADGQLKGSVAPPDEILHYLGQPNWFMRDANFAADFPLTAQRLEWFLEKETGQNVDGVIGMNLGAVSDMLGGVGGVDVSGEKETITAENFFQKAEYAAEINFFPGSTQKRDFLGSVAEQLLGKITGGAGAKNWVGLGQGVEKALEEKEILFYFNSVPVQQMAERNGWSGGIRQGECQNGQQNCLMVVESNFGANKANYFIKQSLDLVESVDKGGGVGAELTLNIRNESPNESWPGGTFKNYMRFLVPMGTKFLGMDLGDGRSATVSSVLTEQVLAKVQKNQFLVIVKPEPGVVGGVATNSAYLSIGVLTQVPAKSNRVVSVKFQWPQRLNFGQNELSHQVTLVKQPGNSIDNASISINYPAFLQAVETGGAIATEQKLSYNTVLNQDQSLKVKFKKIRQ